MPPFPPASTETPSPLSLIVSIDEAAVAAHAEAWTEAIAASLRAAPDDDAAWACWLLLGRRLPRILEPAAQRRLCARLTGHSDWLLEAAREDAGNWPEALALVLNAADVSRQPDPRAPTAHHPPLTGWMETRIAPLAGLDPIAREDAVAALWRECDLATTLLLNRLIAGERAVKLPRTLLPTALARLTDRSVQMITVALDRFERPTAAQWRSLRTGADVDPADLPLSPGHFAVWPERADLPPPQPPDPSLRVEPRPEGQRCQLVRGATCRLWGEDGALLPGPVPDAIAAAAQRLPRGCILDGWLDGATGTTPVLWIVDVLRLEPEAAPTTLPLQARLHWLSETLTPDASPGPLRLNPTVSDAKGTTDAAPAQWLIRRLDACLPRPGDPPPDPPAGWFHDAGNGRIIAALGYARFGPGGRGAPIEEFTFTVPLVDAPAADGAPAAAAQWVPVARVPAAALTDIQGLDAGVLADWIRANATAKYGPVRQIPPIHLFELSGLPTRSKRHRAGLTLDAARVLRWLPEAPADGPTSVETLRRRLPVAADD